MRRLALGLVSLFVVSPLACNIDNPELVTPPETSKAPAEIIGGSQDNVNDATVYLQGHEANQTGYACSGTIIAVNGSTGYVLTAGHCVAGTVDTVVIGANIQTAPQYPVLQQWQHPNFNSQTLRYDFGIVAFSGANANTPVVPAAQSPDGVSPNGTSLELSGFGLTQAGNPPSGQTTHRMHVTETSTDLINILGNQAPDTSIQIGFNQENGTGTCSGDSGGPAYLGSGANRRVVGVTSYGDQSCAQFGVSGRVSAVYTSFIEPILNGQPPMMTCDTCVSTANSPGGACESTVTACQNDAACTALANCLNGCAANDQACVNTCAQNNQNGIAGYNAIFDCSWCNACSTLCDQTQCNMTSSTNVGATTGAGNPSGVTSTGNGSGTGAGNGAGGASSVTSTGAGNNNNNNTGGSNDGTVTVTKCAACAVAPDDGGSGAVAGIGAIALLGLAFSARRKQK